MKNSILIISILLISTFAHSEKTDMKAETLVSAKAKDLAQKLSLKIRGVKDKIENTLNKLRPQEIDKVKAVLDRMSPNTQARFLKAIADFDQKTVDKFIAQIQTATFPESVVEDAEIIANFRSRSKSTR